MNQSQAQNAVLVVVLVSAAVIIWKRVKAGQKATPPGKSLVAFAILAAVLAIGAGVAPSIAGPFAILIGLSIVLANTGSQGSFLGSNGKIASAVTSALSGKGAAPYRGPH